MDIDEILAQQIYVDKPDFYEKAFAFSAKQRKMIDMQNGDNFKRVCAEEYDELSIRLDQTKIQESCSVRNVLRTRRLAKLLINDKGEIQLSALSKVLTHLKSHLYSLGPNRQYDAKRQEQIYNALKALHENKEFFRLIKSIEKPISQGRIDQVIRDTLAIPQNTPLSDAQTRRAVLSAWLCTLRQNVGSCFATAPGIIIHDEQPEQFLKDLVALITTGQLKRIFGGIEYSVPLSISWGAGDLKKQFLFNLGQEFEANEIWLEPGFDTAFEAAKLIDINESQEVRENRLKQLIQEALKPIKYEENSLIITSEELIRIVLLKHMNLTMQDLEDYKNRPQAMVYGNLLMQHTNVTSGSKRESCAAFFSLFNAACHAFKGLADNALLKTWEFSLASFAETKAQFTRWNLYSSLGLDKDSQGGIGACIFTIVKQKLEEANERVAEMQREYETVYQQLKLMEGRIQGVSNEREGQWLRGEYQAKRNEFYTLEEVRNKLNYQAQKLANLYQELINSYDHLFPNYFQEVYDADMRDVIAGPYDDSPAGFRLLYKYGRANTSQWTTIKTPNEFIEALVMFFNATENEIVHSEGFEGMEQEISSIVTAVVNHVRTKNFLETAFYRMAAVHKTMMIKDPLEHLDRIEKKPWAYTSGGSISTLLSCYYKLDYKPTEVSRWVDNPMELCVFLIDTLKAIPPKMIEKFINQPTKSMLIHSPTHAFLLKPGSDLLKSAWQSDVYTYTWVRDTIVIPMKDFVDHLWLNEDEMNYIISRLSLYLPEKDRDYFLDTFNSMYGNKHVTTFRTLLVEGIRSDRKLKKSIGNILNEDQIDSVLHSLLPLFPRSLLRERLISLYQSVQSFSKDQCENFLILFDKLSCHFPQNQIIDAETLQNICKGLICLGLKITSSPLNIHAIVSAAAQKLGYAMPTPMIFADTNWVKEEFGFLVNPGTGNFELWRIDLTGQKGAPMSSWNEWLNGSRREPTWGVFNKPYEYNQ